MKLTSATPRLTLAWVHGSFLLIALMGDATAANQTSGNAQSGERPGFFQRASDNIGGFFHRIFNPDEAPPPPQPQRHSNGQRGKTTRPGGQRYNLDEPPSGVAPTMPKSSQKPSSSNNKTATAPTKSSTGKRPPGETEEPKTTKTKSTVTTSAPEKKDAVVKNTTPEKKSSPESKPPKKTTADASTSPENKSTVKTENPALPKVSQEPSVLTGSKTSKAGRVKSPYPPYNELDVSGLSTGSLALDPTTQKVFRVP
jgi:hypothetical protein